MKLGAIAGLTLVALLAFASPAYAYVDPGTGAMLVQLVTGGVAGLLILLKLQWSRIKTRFGGQRRSPDGAQPDGQPPGTTGENGPI